MKIAIIGAGAMGSLFGGLLSEEHEVTLYNIDRSYVDAVNRNGLILSKGDATMVKHCRVTADPAGIGPQDVVLFQVKYKDLSGAARDALKSAVTEHTLVLSLLNGIGPVDVLKQYFPETQIAYGFSTLTSDMQEPGHVEMTTLGNVGTFMHQLTGQPSDTLKALCASMKRVGLQGEIVEDIDTRIWKKLLVNCCENTLCAVYRVNVSRLMLYNPFSSDFGKKIICEVADVAAAKGLPITRESALQYVMQVTRAVPEHIPSMVIDIRNGEKTEIDALNGAVIAEGRRLGVPVPYNEIVYDLIRGYEENYGKTIY